MYQTWQELSPGFIDQVSVATRQNSSVVSSPCSICPRGLERSHLNSIAALFARCLSV